MTKVKFLSVLLLSCLFFLACSQERHEKGSCSEINSQASEKLYDYLYGDKDQKKLLVALELYDKAIKCDRLNSVNYQGKITVLRLLGKNRESLALLDTLFELSNRSDASVLVSKGILYEKMGMNDSSAIECTRALNIYDTKIKQKSSDSLRLICEKIYLTAITQGKEVAIQKFRPYLLAYPEDSTIKTYEIILRDFDRTLISNGF